MENMELLQAMREMMFENNRQMSEEMKRQLSENNRQMMEEMNRQLSENNRQMMEEMHRQMSENNRQMMEEMHTRIQDAIAPIHSRLDSMDSRLDSMDSSLDSMESRLDRVESELQSVKALATKTQLIVENEINYKLNLLVEGHLDLRNRVAQLEQMNEILHEMQDDVWALKHIVSGRIVPSKPRSIRRKLN